MSDDLYMPKAVQESLFDLEGGEKLSTSKNSNSSKSSSKKKDIPEGFFKYKGESELIDNKKVPEGSFPLNPELDSFRTFGFTDKEEFENNVYKIQSGFVTKVYGIFSVQVLIMAVWVFFC